MNHSNINFNWLSYIWKPIKARFHWLHKDRWTHHELVRFILRMAASLARGNPICRKGDCSRFDLGLVYKEISRYSDLAEKFEFIQNVWKQDSRFKFPQNEEFRKQRKFRQDWLIRYPWLIYSKYLDGAFCLIPCCCLGVECGKNATKLEKLFRSPD